MLLSWFNVGNNALTRFLWEVTEPPLALCRRILPPRPGFPLDFSPIILFIALEIVENVLVRVLFRLL